MTTEDSLDYWHALHTQRSDWAFRAYDKLIETLSEDVQKKLRRSETDQESYVVIFGKTQVGKTTLLLDIMGIDASQMATVSQVLRGGQELGRSATATAMEYCRSINESWGLSRGSQTKRFDSNEEISGALGQLRSEMENGHLLVDSPCVIHIPKKYFSDSSCKESKVRILDLPGDSPANQMEQKHVNLMAKKYLPFADLILLVGKGDDLGFLRPDAITLPGVEDWQAMPYRFRVVTTYSYSAQSVRDLIRKNEEFNVALARQKLIQESETFNKFSEGAQNGKLYFPLEFGTSWMKIQEAEPELYSRLLPIITQLRSELLEQIREAITPLGRLRNIFNTSLSVKYIKNKKIKAAEDAISEFDKKHKKITIELEEWRGLVEKNKNKLFKISEVLRINSLSIGREQIKKCAADLVFMPSAVCSPKEDEKKNDRNTLIKMVYDYHRTLKKMRLSPSVEQSAAYWVKVRKNVVELEESAIDDIIYNAFVCIKSKLDDYVIDKYFISSNYKEDRRAVCSSGYEAKANLIKRWEEAWLVALKKTDSEIKVDERSVQVELDALSEEEKRSNKEHKRIEKKMALACAELDFIERSSQEDLERCNRFIDLLETEYYAMLSEKMDAALKADNDCDALLQIFSCIELKNQRQELMELSN